MRADLCPGCDNLACRSSGCCGRFPPEHWQHELEDHSGGNGHCPAREDVPRTCPICDGGLANCLVCGGAEGSLPTDCPRERMSDARQDAVYGGRLDFRAGRWAALRGEDLELLLEITEERDA